MGMTYQNQRVHFEVISNKYKDYLSLYAALNNGSTEGASTFDEFYLRMIYNSKYADGHVQRSGY